MLVGGLALRLKQMWQMLHYHLACQQLKQTFFTPREMSRLRKWWEEGGVGARNIQNRVTLSHNGCSYMF